MLVAILAARERVAGQLPMGELVAYTSELGRRFRALKLWFVIRTHGSKGLADFV